MKSLNSKIGYLTFQCNICGTICSTHISKISREEISCTDCGSTVRMRAMIHTLSMELFGESLALPDFPKRKDLKGIGMSDWEGYANLLQEKFDYVNTFYHQEPKLDITNIPKNMEGTLDFIVSTDVFEHVMPPVAIAFENARKLLKKGGVFIFSVPYKLEGETIEHFPNLYKYKIIEKKGSYKLVNTTSNGKIEEFSDLVFHGGLGSTLEMRVFSEKSLLEEFNKAGFYETEFYKQQYFDYGIYWKHFSSLPMVGRTSSKIPVKSDKPLKVTINDWGPNRTLVNQGFNIQPDGCSALWINGTQLQNIKSLFLGDYQLPNISIAQSGQLLSVTIKPEILQIPGILPLQANLHNGEVINIGDFQVI